MAAQKYNLTICQGSVFRLSQTLREQVTLFGSDLSSSTFRMQIREPNRAGDPAVVSLESGTTTALGSTISITAEEVIAPIAITKFEGAGKVEAVGAEFQQDITTISSLDENGDPVGLVTTTENVVKIADLARISGSISNDGDYRVGAIDTPDIVELRPNPTNEAAAGTLTILRQGRFEVYITAEESASWDFDQGEYDLEWIETPGAQPIRLLQGFIALDKETTR